MKQLFLIALFILSSNALVYAQDQSMDEAGSTSPFEFSTDLVNRYVWRGLQLSAAPNIQPTLSFTKGGFSIGAWGSYGVGEKFAEADLFVSYSVGSFTFTVNDYYVEDENDLTVNNYFEWGSKTTPHSLEGAITFSGTENFPISITAATFFYGNDWNVNGDNNYSTYFELGYAKEINSYQINLFIGGTPSEGLYSTKAGIVNLGLGLSKSITITDNFSLPVYTSFIVNPSAKDVFMVFGVTL